MTAKLTHQDGPILFLISSALNLTIDLTNTENLWGLLCFVRVVDGDIFVTMDDSRDALKALELDGKQVNI